MKVIKTTSTGAYNDNIVRFDNGTTNWNNAYVHFWSGNTESGTWYLMTDSDGDGIFEFTVPSGTYDHVRFSSDQSATSNNSKTMALVEANGGSGALFTPNISSSKIYFVFGDTSSNAKPYSTYHNMMKAYYYDPSEYKEWGNNNNFQHTNEGNDNEKFSFNLGNINSSSTTYNKLIVFAWNNDTSPWQTESIDVSGTPKHGGGRIYKITSNKDSDGHYKVELLGYGKISSKTASSGTWTYSGTKTSYTLEPYSAQILYSTQFQPEDRYGYIQNSGILY